MRYVWMCLLLAMVLPAESRGQSRVAAEPIVGLRENRVQRVALEHADVVIAPGQSVNDVTVLVEGTLITSVGANVQIPAGTQRIDCTGKTIYAGLIDAWSEIEVPTANSGPGYWNRHITPQRNASSVAAKTVADAKKLRSQGITVRVVAPEGGIVKGSSCVVLLGGASAGRNLLEEHAWQHLQLTVPRGASRSRYPNSPMGAVALLRQSMYDATWYHEAWESYRATPKLDRPETNVALEVLAREIDRGTFVVDAPNERMAIRGDDMAREFSLKMIVRGSGREYRQLDQIAKMNRPILVPVDFPDTPSVKTADAARNTTLQKLMHWDLAPENPSRLVAAGVTICLTTDGLKDVGSFLSQVREAVDRGLDPDDALAAMTTVPARLLEIESSVGRVEPGKLANLVITDGDLFSKKTKIRECWVAGKRFEVSSDDTTTATEIAGTWSVDARLTQKNSKFTLELAEQKGKLSGSLRFADVSGKGGPTKGDSKNANDKSKTDKDKSPSKAKLRDVVRQRDRFTATVRLDEIDDSLPKGVSQITWMTLKSETTQPEVVASITLPDGQSQPMAVRFVPDEAETESASEKDDSNADVAKTDEPKEDSVAKTPDTNSSEDDTSEKQSTGVTSTPVFHPLGAYGLVDRISDQPAVLFRGATIWTCEETGKLESADLLIRDGLIVEVGTNLTAPPDCQIVDAKGKHITPGLIDCHTHMGTDGGVNESGQAVTAEVRIGDFIDNSDILIYRHAAGGVTTANILHGSANPIGGQNQVIKLRWGETMDGLKMKEAPQGIKFALGENVKRTQTRYPNTRMGVEQILRDQLLAAREYQARWRRWRAGDRDSLPPRTDLQLQALSEVQSGERWIHCHSYRQDEVVATLDVLDEFGIQIGTLQHILEGYKVADRIAQHGAMASAFSDWWAYKFEVYDGIPYNGALMHDRGIVVSFNSDDRELARHLNTEAAKATKYGGVPEIEALKFVTLNPAKQLRIDQYVGSIAVGKHADLVVWSGRPLSTLSRCEQTWIDGRRYFDLASDREFQKRDQDLRTRLIQKALAGPNTKETASEDKKIDEEDRWVRHDAFCLAHGVEEYDDRKQLQKQ